jgi:two-component system, NarL family, sensor histidine kinase UhpB
MPSRSRPPRRSRLSLADRALLSSTALLLLIFVLLLVTPVTVSAPVRGSEVVVLGAALVVLVAINAVRVRRTFAPLDRLAEVMERVDPANPTGRRIPAIGEPRDLATFTDAFNAMLDRLGDERRAGARAALLAQERERRRIAQALHDEAGQTLTAVTLEIERAAATGPPEERARMAQLAAQLHRTLDEIRRLGRELRPEALDDLGLFNALIALSTRVARQGNISVGRHIDSDLPELSEELELVIYRVAQEALTNVLRHAGASRCMLELVADPGEIRLTVSDDGRGMPTQLQGGAVGIDGMRERALLVGGSLTIGPSATGGTQVRLTVPREQA